jgi:hypothetical protein
MAPDGPQGSALRKHAPTWFLAAQREHAIAFRWV